ncbi:hypothetical protein Ga0080574_TMP852 [Salipiger abyssi]|uniref:Aminotransferase class I/classII large domain-containing protein n=1 Tax=Salipiger abyssi TaxID=1250539 RepID=A0A1P8UP58_9RHOB|nr:aminotransferase class I/II-fold pyridoxal phosphate-dependent enzyme [Salipiger abyssi]APZ51186.1 hypothetical protein Ga0080574_TMP852 [Salipiger abyssi]
MRFLLRERDRMAAALSPLGFRPLPGAANFLALLSPEGRGDLTEPLREAGIYVIAFTTGARDALRVAIGTPEDTDAVTEALSGILDRHR